MKFLLQPISQIFGKVAAARRAFYEKGFLKSYDLNAPVVSIGNLTVGGTGKTPLVSFVARVLAENGHRVCVLTRGYKRQNPNQRVVVSDGEQILADAQTSGDEPFELANKLLGVASVIADKNRAEAGLWAKKNLGATAFVLDDGFQHLRLKRNLDVVTVDATNPFGNGKLLPAGILREPLESLKRADVVVLTRANLSERISNLKSEIKKNNSNCLILLAKNEIRELKPLADFLKFSKSPNIHSALRIPHSALASAFCALGNPAAFFMDLEKAGFKVVSTESFPDHYAYKQTDIEKLEQKARENGAKMLITTAKDAVKLEEMKFNLSCFVAGAETIFDDATPLLKLLKEL